MKAKSAYNKLRFGFGDLSVKKIDPEANKREGSSFN